MKIFRRFFDRTSKPKEPDNSKLLQLLEAFWKADGTGDTYENVVLELMNGTSFLMLPDENEFDKVPGGWQTTKEAKTIKLSSLYTLDGLKVLAAFTDQKALLDWSKKPCTYTSMRSQDVLKLCDANGISRIVINNNSSNTFVLEKDRSDTKEYMIEEDTEVLLGVPKTPLSRSLLEKLNGRFRELDNIKQVFHYGQTKGNEFSLILGFVLVNISENGKKAVIDLVVDVVGNEELPNPLDIFFIEDEDWRKRIGAIKGSLIYTV